MLKMILTLVVLSMSACAGIEQGDQNQVSIVHLPGEAYRAIFWKAEGHCQRYGKHAVLQARFSSEETTFRCQFEISPQRAMFVSQPVI